MQDSEKQDHSTLQHEADHAKPGKKVSVLVYLVILFAAAFLLLLLSYLMQQRTNADVISSMKDTVSAVQSIENLMDEKDSLTLQVADLQDQLDAQSAAASSAQAENASLVQTQALLQKQLEAMDWLRELQGLYEKQYYKTARAMIAEFEASGLVPALPSKVLHAYGEEQIPSPASEYQMIYDALITD